MKRIGVISDPHIGSAYGLSFPTFRTKFGNDVSANEKQLFLYDLWKGACSSLKKHKVTDLLILGDIVDGLNPKERGYGITLTALGDQRRMALELLRMTGCKRFYGVEPSGYHGGNNESEDERILEALDGKFDVEMALDIEDVTFYLHHTVGGSSYEQYRTTPLAQQMVRYAFNKDLYGNIDVMLFGHVHYFVEVGYSKTHAFTVPSWKFSDKFLAKNPKFTFNPPKFGWLEFEINGDEWSVEKHLFDPDVEYVLPRHRIA